MKTEEDIRNGKYDIIGKTYFIKNNYADKVVEILNVYDYQQRVYEEEGYGDPSSFITPGANFSITAKCAGKRNSSPQRKRIIPDGIIHRTWDILVCSAPGHAGVVY